MCPQCHPLFVYEALLAKQDRQFWRQMCQSYCVYISTREGGGGTKAYEHCQSTRVHEVIWPYSARASFDLFRPGGWRIQPPSPP